MKLANVCSRELIHNINKTHTFFSVMMMVYTNLVACCTRVPLIPSLNTATFSDIPEGSSCTCDNLAMLGRKDRTGVINLVSTDPPTVMGP
jgi:hypothetical protein